MNLKDVDALLADIEQTVRISCREGMQSAEMRGANKVIDRIKAAPTLSPDDVRGVGEWIDKCVRAWSCSYCGMPLNHIRQFASFEKNELPNYCPNCGAKMKGAKDGTTDNSYGVCVLHREKKLQMALQHEERPDL